MTKQPTPYDTGERLEPRVWPTSEPGVSYSRTRYGKVDFDNDEGATVFTAYAEKNGDGYTLKVQDLSSTPLSVEVDGKMLSVAPVEKLQENVQNTILADLDPRVRDEAEVYYAPNGRRALILVPGEKHVRKQLLIMVTDVGDGEPYSAYVKGWAGGVRETRL